jgi:hypothetical protein
MPVIRFLGAAAFLADAERLAAPERGNRPLRDDH